jgi:hypothetical protein
MLGPALERNDLAGLRIHRPPEPLLVGLLPHKAAQLGGFGLKAAHEHVVYHMQAAAQPEPEQRAIYQALGLPSLPDRTEKTFVELFTPLAQVVVP